MKTIILILINLMAYSALANSEAPYSGQEKRAIKALSHQQVSGYLAGKGLGLAKAAELNHFPGPKHVLDAAEQLALTPEQIIETEKLFDSMQAQAVVIGQQIVEQERLLDQYFANGSIDSDKLKTLLTEIATLKGNVRYVHLNTHILQKRLLNEHQVNLYDKIRGYGDGQHTKHMH